VAVRLFAGDNGHVRTIAIALLLAIAFTGEAQTPESLPLNPEWVYLRDYTFERMEATRKVRDAEDRGTLRLVTFVYRPVKTDRHEVVLWSHGSTAGWTRAPKEQGDAPTPAVLRFFLSRGYTVVAPMRRGRGESSGTYVEECPVYAGRCSAADQIALGERGLREALLDTYAVLDQIVYRLVPRQSKIIAAGHSRGGFLSLILAGERPQAIKVVVNFAGGWQAMNDRVPPQDHRHRVEVQAIPLRRAAKNAQAPSIWIYADRDTLYNEAGRQGILKAWRDGGGNAEYFLVTEHALPNGHAIPTNATYWEAQLDTFLRSLNP
jgi:pimeloyl-ACP methyl ester carboxylesterase